MSEFICANGHVMSYHDLKCPECGGPVMFIDGEDGLRDKDDEEDPQDDFDISFLFRMQGLALSR